MQGVSSTEGTLFFVLEEKAPCKFIWEERRMKKFLILLLSAVLSLACVMGFAACDETPPNDETGGIVQPGDPDDTDPGDPEKPHEHNFGEWVVTIPATCTEAGEEQRTCSCGETETRPIAAKGHTEAIDAAVAPTCTEPGQTEGKYCSVCHTVLVAQEPVAAVGHAYVDGVCTVCGVIGIMVEDGLEFSLSVDGSYYSVSALTSGRTEVNIPASLHEIPVREIAGSAFADRADLESVQISDGIQSIGDFAFVNCSALKSVSLGEGLLSVGASAFEDCVSLSEIEIPKSVVSIGKAAFEGCHNLVNVYLADIAAWCAIDFRSSSASPFYNAENLYLNGELVTDLVVPDGVTSIGNYAFYSCDGLTSVSIPSSVISIGNSAFTGCDSLTSVYITDLAAWRAIVFGEGISDPLHYASHLYCNGQLVTDLTSSGRRR